MEEIIQTNRPEAVAILGTKEVFPIGKALEQYNIQKQDFQAELAGLTKGLGTSYNEKPISVDKQSDGWWGEFRNKKLNQKNEKLAMLFNNSTGVQAPIPFFPSLNPGDHEAAKVTFSREEGYGLSRYKFAKTVFALGQLFFEKFWKGSQAKGRSLLEGTNIQYAKFLNPQDNPGQVDLGDLPSVHMIKVGPSGEEIILGTGHVADENDPKVVDLVKQVLSANSDYEEAGSNRPAHIIVFRQGSAVQLNGKPFHLEASMSIIDTNKLQGDEVKGGSANVSMLEGEESLGPIIGTRITFQGVETNTFMAKAIAQEAIFPGSPVGKQELQKANPLWLQKIEKPDGQIRFEDYVNVQEVDVQSDGQNVDKSQKAIVIYVQGKPAFIFDGLDSPQSKKMFYSIMFKLASDFKGLHSDVYKKMHDTAYNTDQPVFLEAGQYGIKLEKEVRDDGTEGEALIPTSIVKFQEQSQLKEEETSKEFLTYNQKTWLLVEGSIVRGYWRQA